MFIPGKKVLQFVIGPEVEIITKNMKKIMSNLDKYK